MHQLRRCLVSVLLCFAFAAHSEEKKSHAGTPAVGPRTLAESDLKPAGPCNTIAYLLKLNGRIPKTVDEWQQDLGKFGGVSRSNVPFSLSPQPASLEEPRVVFVVDPKLQSSTKLRVAYPFAIAGIRRKDGTLDKIEFIAPPLADEIRDPEFGVVRDGVPKVVTSEFCFGCHKNRAFIFSEFPWVNTTIDPSVKQAAYEILKKNHPDKLRALDKQIEDLKKEAEKAKEGPLKIDAESKMLEAMSGANQGGIHLQDAAFIVDSTIGEANKTILAQRWLNSIPDAKIRTDFSRKLVAVDFAQRLREPFFALQLTQAFQVPKKGAEDSAKPLVDNEKVGKAIVALQPLLTAQRIHVEAHDIGSRFNVSELPSAREAHDLDQLLKRDRTAGLSKLRLNPLSHPETFKDGSDLFSVSGDVNTSVVHFPKTDFDKMYEWLDSSLMSLSADSEKRARISSELFDRILSNPILEREFNAGRIPSSEKIFDAVRDSTTDYLKTSHKSAAPAWPNIASAQPEKPCDIEKPKTSNPSATRKGKCASCHRGSEVETRLIFSVDPTDAATREAWFENNDPSETKKLITKFWKRAIVEQNMPSTPLSRAEFEDLKGFLKAKASKLGLSLPKAPNFKY